MTAATLVRCPGIVADADVLPDAILAEIEVLAGASEPRGRRR